MDIYFMELASVVYQLFGSRLPDSSIDIIVAIVVEYILVAGVDCNLHSFFSSLDQTFSLGSTIVDRHLSFLGCDFAV